MIENLLDPITLFFALGLVAGISRSDLRLPQAVYELLSIFLLLAIGLKGGVQLASAEARDVLGPAFGTLLLGLTIPFIAYGILRRLGGFSVFDSAALSAHYGSVSAVTFAVVLTYLEKMAVSYEGFMAVLLVLLEIPAIAVGIFLARFHTTNGEVPYRQLISEVFVNRSILLLVGGLGIGWLSGPEKMTAISPVFFDGFKGALAFFLLEMGILTAQRLADLKKVGLFLIGFGIGMPLLSALLGIAAGWICGLSVGGAIVLATMTASASYIAAPAAMRIAVPEANPTLYLTAALGITFPFNLALGIPIYYHLTLWFYQ